MIAPSQTGGTAPSLELVGIGSPIMDLSARVAEEFLGHHVAGSKGGMVLVDGDEMHRILSRIESEIDHSTGGSAANVTFNATRLGLRTTFVGKVGNDDFARRYQERFASVGVDITRFKRGDRANARCLALITPDAQRTMRTDLGAALTLAPSELTAADFAGCRHAHVEGYLVFNQALADTVLAGARSSGCTVSLDLSSFEVVAASRDWLFSQFKRGIDIVFANEDEIRALFPDSRAGFDELARELARQGVTAAVKVGKDGAWIARDTESHRIAPMTVAEVVDTNGAGDAWAAGFLYGLLRGWSLPAAGRLASHMGAETVRHIGPLIPHHHWSDVRTRALVHAPA